MPQIVESDPPQLRCFKNPVAHVADVRFVQQGAVGGGEHHLRARLPGLQRALALLEALCRQRVRQLSGHIEQS